MPKHPYNGDYSLSGYVLDEITSAPISGAEVFILEKEGGILVQTPDKQIAFAKTDGNGYYEIKFPVQAAGYLYMFQARAQDINYFTKPNPERITIAKSGKSTFDWKLEPPAYVNLKFIGSGNATSLDYTTSNSLGKGGISGDADTSFLEIGQTLSDFTIMTWVNRGRDLLYKKEHNLGILSPFDTASYTIHF
ncbi:MAG: hypothetical protein EP332_02815 [Bacteroidetes bacterium]|nr:MAG: hypothetical protein EP332_02815 [Bacteroidota bacterium]